MITLTALHATACAIVAVYKSNAGFESPLRSFLNMVQDKSMADIDLVVMVAPQVKFLTRQALLAVGATIAIKNPIQYPEINHLRSVRRSEFLT